jgi:hypothetical protein
MLCFLRSTLLAVHVRADRTQDLLAPTFICAAVTSLQGEPRNRVPSCRLSIGDSNWTENSAHARSGSNNPGHVKREKRCQQQVLLISDIAKGSDPGWAASLPLSFPLSPIGNCHPDGWRSGPLVCRACRHSSHTSAAQASPLHRVGATLNSTLV